MMKNGLFLLLLCLIASSPVYGTEAYLTIERGDLLLSAQTTPPDAGGAWRTVRLPDEWDVERYAISDNGWYRFSLDLPPPRALWAVYLPRLNMNAAVYFNDQFLGDGGRFDEPLGRNWSRPLYFTIPAALWREDGNLLMIRLKSYPGYGLLDKVIIGPDALLQAEFQRQRFWRTEVAGTLFLLLSGIAVFMFSIWHRRHQDTLYLWFALASLAWSFLALNMVIREIPVSARLWDGFMFSNVAWWTVFLALFSHRFAAIRYPRLEALYLLYGIAATTTYFSVSLPSLPTATLIWQMGSPLIGFAVLLLLVLAWWRRRCTAVALLAVGIGLIQGAGILSYLIQSRVVLFSTPLLDHILPFFAPIMLIIIALHLVQRFVTALNESEVLNTELEARVASKAAELEQSYAKLRDLERQQAISAERERIHRDLHDDVGAKLLSLTYHSENEEHAEIARSALQDLRDVVSRSSKANLSLAEALADWRAECAERLEGAGIDFHWRQPRSLPEWILADQQIMNIGRILREAVSNAIRHGQPENLFVTFEEGDEKIVVVIENDGHDCEAADIGRGRGTQNMIARAAQLGGGIQWRQRASGGCVVRWWFPLVLPE